MVNLYCGDCVSVMSSMLSESIDLVVTSPPYDGIRTYGNVAPPLNLHSVGKEVFRLLKPGGVCVLVIQDQTLKGHKTLTTFKTIIDWCDIGFGLFETIIYSRNGCPGAWWNRRFRVDHEYIPIFVKGQRPAHFDKSSLLIPSKHPGVKFQDTKRQSDGSNRNKIFNTVKDLKCPGTIWNYSTSNTEKMSAKRSHPATFPDKLPNDFIRCFTQEGDTVLDPFMGSGTTGVAAVNLNRNFVGIEINRDYYAIAERLI